MDEEFKKIKDKLKKIDWYKVSNNWKVSFRKNQYSDYNVINLNPYQDCSPENPLYMHKDWIEYIYNDKNFQLTDKKLAKLCNITKEAVYYWRKKKYGIIGKDEWGKGCWIDSRSGRGYIRVPKDYNHPQLKLEKGRKKTYRLEHIYIMEKFLSEHPELEISQKYLIGGKYLKIECEVHHISRNFRDNRIEYLWVYENKVEHAKGEKTLYNVLSQLIKIGQIIFKNGKYYLNNDFDYRISNCNLSEKNLKNPINFKNLDLVQKEIKNFEWFNISDDWKVREQINQFIKNKICVDPFLDCSEENPLFKHKKWVETVVNDERFNLTDSRLGKLCGISKDKARYWRDKVHKIKGKTDWGYEKIIDENDGRIWIRVPKSYVNPVVHKKDHQRRYMLEHRYKMEQYLAKFPHLEISKKCLVDSKYIKTECPVHHINLDYQDNRIENLWLFESKEQHNEAIKSLFSLVELLLNLDLILFNSGKYTLNF